MIDMYAVEVRSEQERKVTGQGSSSSGGFFIFWSIIVLRYRYANQDINKC